MARDKVQIIYILSLLILGILLVLFAQGVFSGLSTNYSEPIIEINRIDLFNCLSADVWRKIDIFPYH